MEQWQKISLLLCVYGILKEFRPSEPFVTKYLNNPPMNFTRDEISNEIYPVAIYSSMALLVVEVLYGLFMSCEVAYYTYIYAKVDKVHYQEVSGHTRAAYLVGRAVSGVVSQILVLTNFSYYILNFFTLGGMLCSLIWALFLPSVSQSLYFNKTEQPETAAVVDSHSTDNLYHQNYRNVSQNKIIGGFQLLWIDFKTAFTNLYVVKWAFWWALATCGYYQILSYIQLLWEEILKDEGTKYYTKLNGATEAAYTIASAISAFCFGKLMVDWSVYGELVLFICSIGIGILLMVMAETPSIWVAYGTKVVYAMIYHSMITVSNSEVAKHVNQDSYGLIFGFTTFVALVLQSILTIIVINTLKLPIRMQFVVYSGYFIVLGLIFGLKTMVTYIRRRCSSNRSVTITDEVQT
ncbi:folate transporter 1-like isoform X2 [Rhodnius prolixus]|uniref:folate transporter 1-like isoform X2 n=1 Tax=Rhodnius prolixus TaxID=13249 RepID=UPI003D18D36B